MGVLSRSALGLLIVAQQLLASSATVKAEPASQPVKKVPSIAYSFYGGWGSFSVLIEPDGTFRTLYGKERRGRLDPARHAEIVSAVQEVLKLRKIPWNPDPQVLHRMMYSLSWGGVIRNWDHVKGDVPPELTRLEKLLDPARFELDAPSTQPAREPGQ